MQGNKTLIALVAVIVVAGGAYALLSGSTPTTPAAMEQVSNDPTALPVATDSVDDFAAAIDADLAATAAALNAFDADVTTAVSEVSGAADVTQLYDPEQI